LREPHVASSQSVSGGVGKEGEKMLGIPDFWISSAYVLSILSAVACIVYGIINWNKGGNDEVKQIQEEKKWEKAEEEVEAKL